MSQVKAEKLCVQICLQHCQMFFYHLNFTVADDIFEVEMQYLRGKTIKK
jgi:hypothetical protein